MKKFVIGIFLFSILYSLFSPAPIQASYLGPGSPGSPDSITGNTDPYLESYTKSVYDKPTEFNQASYINFANRYLISSGLDMMLGKDYLQTLSSGRQTNAYIQDRGLLGFVTNLITVLYVNPPVSGINYLASVTSNLGFSTPVYAQTTGFKGLEPVLPIWKIVRDATYLAFVIIFIVIGIMIMLRSRIDPRTVVSIQDSIPKIIIALILVTFSYAISGLFVDLTLVFLNLIVTLFSPLIQKSPGLLDDVRNTITGPSSNIFELLNPIIGTAGTVGGTIKSIMEGLFKDVFFLSGLFAWGSGGIGQVIFVIILVSAMFRVFFMLVVSYVTILILTIISPIQFLLGALPIKAGFGGWFKSMLVNTLVFPITGFMLLLIAIFMRVDTFPFYINTDPKVLPEILGWIPPFIGGGSDATRIRSLIAIGLILMMPNIKGLISETLQYKEPQGAQIGGSIASAAGRIPVVGGLLGGAFR